MEGEGLGEAVRSSGLFEHNFNKPPTDHALVLISSI